MNDNIHSGHRGRMKAKLLEFGIDCFDEHQVLEIMLYYCYSRRDTNIIAHRMLAEFGTLSNLFEAEPTEIMKRCKVSFNVAFFVTLIPSITRRYMQSKWDEEKIVIDSSKTAGEYCLSLFAGLSYECFYILCLNGQNQLLHSVNIFQGTVNEAPIYPREIVETVLRFHAVNIILAHNHPSGILTPSSDDIRATQKIAEALKHVNVAVTDHIVVAGNKYYSFSVNNMLPGY